MYNVLYVNDIVEDIFDIELLFENKIDKYNLLLARDEKEALSLLKDNIIDLVLLDIDDLEFVKSNKTFFNENTIIIFLIEKKKKEGMSFAFKYGSDYLLKPLREDTFFTRIESHLEIIEVKNRIQIKEDFTQSILDSQQNMILIYDNYDLLNANQSFYSFYNVNSVAEFKSKFGSIVDLFMEYENYFSLNKLNNNKPWLSELSSKKNESYSILLLNHNTFEPETFKIDVNAIDNSDKYVVTLTNVTSLITQSKKFEMKATYDILTNIYNRSKFNECMDDQYNLFVRYGSNVSFAIFDIDFFKDVNDNYGHIIGDKTLITFAQTIIENIRNTDIFARWGGEEFTLLLPCTKLEDAILVVNNLRKIIEQLDFKVVGQKTCSIGVTQFKKGDTIDSVLLRADEALYEAKETGRNKVCTK